MDLDIGRRTGTVRTNVVVYEAKEPLRRDPRRELDGSQVGYYWQPLASPPTFSQDGLASLSSSPRQPLHLIRNTTTGCLGAGAGGRVIPSPLTERRDGDLYPLVGILPGVYPEFLGERSFLAAHQVRFPYVAGEMANGIASVRLVLAMAGAQMLAFFGAGGLGPPAIRHAIREIKAGLNPPHQAWGANLIHSPHEPALELATAELYLDEGVRRVCASAYMRLTPAVVLYACRGLRLDSAGRIQRVNHVFAKVSRAEVAAAFMSPPPAELVGELVRQGRLTAAEAQLAKHVPVAEDITVEADSGGHTDNRPLVSLLPTILGLRDQLMSLHRYASPLRVGAAGGLGTPGSVAAAFALGAAYVLTGSVNQCAVESGLSTAGKLMLAQAEMTDVVMAPSPDMFELGVKVQVLKRGTLFPGRATRLYELYRNHGAIEEIPVPVRAQLEKDVFRMPLGEVWNQTRQFFVDRDSHEWEQAETDPKRRMALVFRWYVGQASHWALQGVADRRSDYQIWCGPAMGAFNAWVRGSFLEDPANRTVVQIAKNLLEGAATITRAQQLRCYGLPLPDAAFQFVPRPLQ